MSSKKSRQVRVEAQRAAKLLAQERARFRRNAWIAAGTAVVVLGVVITVVALTNRGPSAVTSAAGTPSASPSASPAAGSGRTTPPPWPIPADAAASVAAAGLPMLGAEGNALHFHTHLDIFVNGSPVAVPAEIGIDHARNQISPLHSHDLTGVIHIESADAKATFTLGQFFTEWQVSLGADHIGGLRADAANPFKVYVNGAVRDGDPAGIQLAAHDEIALVYGSAPATVPSSYAWTNGL